MGSAGSADSLECIEVIEMSKMTGSTRPTASFCGLRNLCAFFDEKCEKREKRRL